ncbi:subtilisin-like protein [Mycena vulgaris]|nr:subtilisin-like protein [Mycena vulgaris]
MLARRFSFLAAFIGLACGKDEFVLHERRDVAPPGFTLSGAAPGDTTLNLRINLAQNNLPGLEAALSAISDPSSPWYGQWLAKEEVESFSRPSETTVAAITTWLSEHGLKHTSIPSAGDWIAINVSVAQANRMFDADFSVFTHPKSSKGFVRTLQYSIPASLANHIRFVTPATSFPPLQHSRRPEILASRAVVPEPRGNLSVSPEGIAPASCASAITPSCLQTLYNIPKTAATSKTNRIGVVGFDNEFANSADLRVFLTRFRPDILSTTTFTLSTLDGGLNTQTLSLAGEEADLDIQYTVGLATGVPVNFISVGTINSDGADLGFLDVIHNLLAQAAPPQVLTTSYQFDEADINRPTATGVSVIFAAGDGGVAGVQSQSCTTFIPTFPGSCPFTEHLRTVYCVGATQVFQKATATSLFSCGFSNIFPATRYICGLGTQFAESQTTGLGPLTSLRWGKFDMYWMGSRVWSPEPPASKLHLRLSIGLLNDELVAQGKPVLGFLNPWMYANPGAFNDITTGSNPGCSTTGFPAKAGWDPVTGLGTPNYALMRTAAGVDAPGCTC